MKSIASIFAILFLALTGGWHTAYAQSSCDSLTACVGNALAFPGGQLDYVDVFTTPALSSVDTSRAISVVLWANVTRRPGAAQYLGGVWGPRTDRDDKWILYVDENDSLTFELSSGATSFGRFDNTIAKAPMIYGAWMYIAAMWEGSTQTARLYIDGRLAATARNADYPMTSFHSTISYLQFATFNGQSNDTARTKTLTGQLDEIRLWNRALGEDELRCQRNAALEGNEPGLILYLRCNEPGGDVMCDASRFGTRGNRRGAARFLPSTRTVPPSVFVTPVVFAFPLGCTADTTLTVSITDTSACAQRVTLALSGADAASFALGGSSFTLQRNQPVRIPIRTNIRISGRISAALTVTPLNTCNPETVIPIDIDRKTMLVPSMGRVRFDTLFGCVNRTVADTVVRLCNQSGGPLTISALSVAVGAFIPTPVGWTPPDVVQPGDCRDVLLRFAPPDTGDYADTLRIASTDPCPGSGLIPIAGRSQRIWSTTIASANFDQPLPCRRTLNLAQEFFFRNLTGENYTVEAIEFKDPNFSSPTIMPFTARPNTAYRMYIRFRSSTEGYYTDTARIRMNFRGCIVYRDIPVAGRIIDVKLATVDSIVQFGNVLVGQQRTLPAAIANNGIDARQLFVYLTSGRAFSLAGGSSFSLAPSAQQSVNVSFRPLSAGFFRDTLNFQDVGCQMIKRVILEGTGIFGSLVFQPGSLQAGNVINCRCRQDTVRVTNNTGAPLTLRSVTIAGSAKFTFLAPLPASNEILQPSQQRVYLIQYCPAGASDVVTERADLVFDTDGPDGMLRMLLTGTNIEPKLTIEDMTNYGDVEVGTAQVRILHLTNPSPTPVRVDSIPPLPAGFSVVGTAPPIGSVLQYRDTMLVSVQFAPPNNITYTGSIRAVSTDPCAVSTAGALAGRGIIVPLFVPWSTIVFSEATRCDSVVRVLGLVNDGSVPIRVDSIRIGGRDAAAFDWRGRTFAGPPPRDVPPRFADSIDIIYHPVRSPNVQSQAQMRIVATTRLGPQTFLINLVGGRILQYIPNRGSVVFPATPVRTAAAPITLNFQNPSYLETLVIDSVSFMPSQGVFSRTGALPLTIPPRQTGTLSFGFFPRAALPYAAKIRLVTHVACTEVDTTISISGEGYTPPWLTTICADSNVVANIGDLLRLPVLLNRNIPQNPLDVDLFIGFHRRALEYLGFEPVYSAIPARDTLRPDGVKLSLRMNQNMLAGPIGYINFRVAASDSMSFFLRTDSIAFGSDSVFVVALFGDGCIRTLLINPRCGVDKLAFSANRYELRQNYPNPFAAVTTIEFETLEDAPVRIDVRNTAGRVVAVLTEAPYTHGRYRLSFDASPLPSGVYEYRMQTPTFTAARTMMVIK
jgi:hypothetical protein